MADKPKQEFAINYGTFTETAAKLKALGEKHPAALVAYSGGMDSLVCLDLCSKAFKKVVCFYMYLVPDLGVAEKQLAYAREHYGVDILQYPHWVTTNALKYGVYCNNGPAWDSVKEQNLDDVHEWVKADTGIPIICHGAKKSDSLWRRRTMSMRKNRQDGVFYPLAEWNKYEVFAYLGMNHIPLPQSETGNKRATSGLDLTTEVLLWLHDQHREDFDKVADYFPYVWAVIKRRDWFGIAEVKEQHK